MFLNSLYNKPYFPLLVLYQVSPVIKKRWMNVGNNPNCQKSHFCPFLHALAMSAPKRDIHRETNKLTAPRRNRHDRSSAHNPGSIPTLPLLTSCSAVFMGEPPTDHPLKRPQISQLPDISVVELPQLIATVGPELAMADSVWTEGPGLTSSALTADIPLKAIKHPQKIKTK